MDELESEVGGRLFYKELSLQDIRQVFQILEECRDRWDDPTGWQQHLLQRAARLIGLPVGLYSELLDFEAGKLPRILWLHESGWRRPEDKAAFFTGRRSPEPVPFNDSPLDLRFRERLTEGHRVTCTRSDLMSDEEWRNTSAYRLYHKPARMEEVVYSAIRLKSGQPFNVLAFGGDTCTPGLRERQILELLHQELIMMVGTRLSTISHYSRHGLSPRLREIMDFLCRGLQEKEIAARLSLSRSTVSEHLQRLYRHFNVHSRAELMAYLLERKPLRRDPRIDGGGGTLR